MTFFVIYFRDYNYEFLKYFQIKREFLEGFFEQEFTILRRISIQLKSNILSEINRRESQKLKFQDTYTIKSYSVNDYLKKIIYYYSFL